MKSKQLLTKTSFNRTIVELKSGTTLEVAKGSGF